MASTGNSSTIKTMAVLNKERSLSLLDLKVEENKLDLDAKNKAAAAQFEGTGSVVNTALLFADDSDDDGSMEFEDEGDFIEGEDAIRAMLDKDEEEAEDDNRFRIPSGTQFGIPDEDDDDEEKELRAIARAAQEEVASVKTERDRLVSENASLEKKLDQAVKDKEILIELLKQAVPLLTTAAAQRAQADLRLRETLFGALVKKEQNSLLRRRDNVTFFQDVKAAMADEEELGTKSKLKKVDDASRAVLRAEVTALTVEVETLAAELATDIPGSDSTVSTISSPSSPSAAGSETASTTASTSTSVGSTAKVINPSPLSPAWAAARAAGSGVKYPASATAGTTPIKDTDAGNGSNGSNGGGGGQSVHIIAPTKPADRSPQQSPRTDGVGTRQVTNPSKGPPASAQMGGAAADAADKVNRLRRGGRARAGANSELSQKTAGSYLSQMKEGSRVGVGANSQISQKTAGRVTRSTSRVAAADYKVSPPRAPTARKSFRPGAAPTKATRLARSTTAGRSAGSCSTHVESRSSFMKF